MSIVARQINIARTKGERGTFIQSKNPNEQVTAGYFRTALIVCQLSRHKRVIVVDIVGSKIIWAFEKKYNSCQPGIIRFSNLISCKKGSGFIVRGKFIKIKN